MTHLDTIFSGTLIEKHCTIVVSLMHIMLSLCGLDLNYSHQGLHSPTM